MSPSSFEKVYILDTNIILSDVVNVEILSQKSSNLIVIPETVMDELDVKKSGFSEINYQARSFGRLLEKADILSVRQEDGYVISRMYINGEKNITVDVVSLMNYPNLDKMDSHIINDRKILEVAIKAKQIYQEDVVFISNDVMCRLRAISLGLTTEPFGVNNEVSIDLYAELKIEDIGLEEFPENLEAPKGVGATVHGLCLYSDTGNRKYYYRSGLLFYQIQEGELIKQNIKPMNAEQKILSSLMLDPYYDLVVVEAPAGTGKTSLALSAAMKLIDAKMSPYDKIIYIRKTIISSDIDLGFMKGSLEEKMSGYLAPLYSTLEAIALTKYGKKKLSKEEIEVKTADIIKDYNISALWQGHLRGATIRNAVVIYDEASNDSVSDIRTTLTRCGENCKVFVVGSLKQIDNKYVNKFNSGLTYLLNKIAEDCEVKIAGMILTKTVRSRIAEWADKFK